MKFQGENIFITETKMSEIYKEQWERRKWEFLIRSLFDEDPKSSPMPERQELTPPSEVTINRPLSPLPNLIIEKEPNRHDEPEEFYQELEKEIKELYRNLFLDPEKFSQCSEQLRNSDKTNNSVSQFIEQHCYDSKNNEAPENCPTEDISCEEDQSYEDNITNDIQNKKNLTDSTMLGSTTPESRNGEIIVTQALVHQVNDEEADREIHRRLETGCGTNASSSPEEPEIMRGQETSNDSVQSINALDLGRHFSADFSGDKIFETTSVRALEEAEVSSYDSSVILGITSTPRIPTKLNADRKRQISSDNRPSLTKKKHENKTTQTRKRRIFSENRPSLTKQKHENITTQTRKRRISSETRPSLTKKKYKNITTQTSFSSSDTEDNWREVLEHFLKGKLRSFKLCSCKNHTCS